MLPSLFSGGIYVPAGVRKPDRSCGSSVVMKAMVPGEVLEVVAFNRGLVWIQELGLSLSYIKLPFSKKKSPSIRNDQQVVQWSGKGDNKNNLTNL